MTPRTSPEQLRFARASRRGATTAETMLWRSLRHRGLKAKFRRQVPIGPYVADFACVAARLLVELDGAPHETPEARAKDAARDRALAARGWRVLRVPNDVVTGGGDIVLDLIRAALAAPPSSDPR